MHHYVLPLHLPRRYWNPRKINTFSYLFYILLLVIRKTTNIFFKKNHLRQPLLLQGCAKKSANIFFAACQLSLLIQYLTLGASTSPWIKPASFNSFKCCETVALAIGEYHRRSNYLVLPRKQELPSSLDVPLLWQNELSVPDLLCAVYLPLFYMYHCLLFAKLRTISDTCK